MRAATAQGQAVPEAPEGTETVTPNQRFVNALREMLGLDPLYARTNHRSPGSLNVYSLELQGHADPLLFAPGDRQVRAGAARFPRWWRR